MSENESIWVYIDYIDPGILQAGFVMAMRTYSLLISGRSRGVSIEPPAYAQTIMGCIIIIIMGDETVAITTQKETTKAFIS
jgi:hypothetical protein